jgi:putative membrane protein
VVQRVRAGAGGTHLEQETSRRAICSFSLSELQVILFITTVVPPMSTPSISDKIFALERPDPSLWTLYLLRALLTGPFVVFLLPLYFFRYRTLRYRFDEEGIHMRVGVLYRREVNLTYARIQDIHLQSGVLQRWLKLADIQIQTASGSAGAELVIEGFKEFEEIRDFLYGRMRGTRAGGGARSDGPPPLPHGSGPGEEAEVVALLLNIRDELRHTRELLEQRNTTTGRDHV